MSIDKKKYQVLLLEDDREICDLIRSFVSMGTDDINIVEANSRAQAIFKLSNQEFDLFIIDKVLPFKTGFDFIRSIRTMPKYRRTDIIFMSGSLSRGDVLTAVSLEITHILVKPFTFSQLMDKFISIFPNLDKF